MMRVKLLATASARGVIRGYQLLVSPFLGPVCRYEPSCSHYADQAIARYGLVRGGVLAVRRLFRCHPFRPGGYDPVPERISSPEAR
jgi:putative membrane protein insertion efficiency factor